MTLHVRTEMRSDDRATLHLEGRLDAATYIDFDAAVETLLESMPESGIVVSDLSRLEYISSAGLRSFARIRKRMRAHGGYSLLLHPQPQVRKAFDIVKAVPLHEIFHDAQDLEEHADRLRTRHPNAPDKV